MRTRRHCQGTGLYAEEQAANDFPAGAKERVVVLVSDGKETCQGDPAVAAKALAAKGITAHTVGFVVDSTARRGPKKWAPLLGERGARALQWLAGKARVGTLAPAHPYNTRSLGEVPQDRSLIHSHGKC